METGTSQRRALRPHERERFRIFAYVRVEVPLQLHHDAARKRHLANGVLRLRGTKRELTVHFNQDLGDLHRACQEIDALSAEAGKLTKPAGLHRRRCPYLSSVKGTEERPAAMGDLLTLRPAAIHTGVKV